MNKRILFLGDIHGIFSTISKHIKKYDINNAHIIQLGDFNIGYLSIDDEYDMLIDINELCILRNINIFVVRGNHDNPAYFSNEILSFTNIHFIPDYSVITLENQNILFLGGGISIDRKILISKYQENIQPLYWWENEAFNLDIDAINELRNIDIVVTHTAPDYCYPSNINGIGKLPEKLIDKTGDLSLRNDLLAERKNMRTAFDILKRNNEIKYHYYGHFHDSNIEFHDNTKHILLDSNELYEEDRGYL